MTGDTVPPTIRAAGERATAAYESFFEVIMDGSSARHAYWQACEQFFRWTQARGLTLDRLTRDVATAYANPGGLDGTALRSLFRHFAESGLVAENPFEPDAVPVRSRRPAPPPDPELLIARTGPDTAIIEGQGACGKTAGGDEHEQEPVPKLIRDAGEPNGREGRNPHDTKAPDIPLAELKRIVRQIGEPDGWEESDENFQAGLVMLAPLAINTMDPAAVSRFTGVPEATVREFAERLWANGIWQPDGCVAFGGDDDFALMLDVWVATGMLARRAAHEDDANPSGDAPDDRARN